MIPHTTILRLRRNTTKATGKKRREPRKEAVPKYGDFMPYGGLKRLRGAHKSERPGKSQIIPRACEMRKKGMGIRPIMRKLQQAYSTVRDWLLRMMGTDLDRRHDKQRGRKRKKPDAAARKAILERVDNSPTVCGFAAGTRQLAMISAMLERELNVECKPRTPKRVMKRTKCSYTKARPVPRKSATKEEREEFMSETDATLAELIAKGHVAPCGDEACVLRWNGGGYGWRRTGGRYTGRTAFSRQSVKMFGALGKDGFYILPRGRPELRDVHRIPEGTAAGISQARDDTGQRRVPQVPRGVPVHRADRRGHQADLPAPGHPADKPDRGAVHGAQAPAGRRYFESVDELGDAIAQNEMDAIEINVYAT